MSDQIPFHIQEEIMKRLPVKSLVQFRCVSKGWKSLIDSSEFIAAHSLRCHTQPQHLFVSDGDAQIGKNYFCFVDDDTFPQQMSVPTLPLSVKELIFPRVFGSSHGLMCLYGYDSKFTTKMAVLWNPSIRKSIAVVVPGKPSFGPGVSREAVGFGVCPVTGDPKLVSIIQSWDDKFIETSYRFKVMVYTLSLGKWRSLSSSNLPTKPVRHAWSLIVTDRFIYWNAGLTYNMIMSFDVTNESFEVIDLPAKVARYPRISKIRESLAILDYFRNYCCTVWMMEDGVQRSFTELFTIELTPCNFHFVGLRKNGIPIMQTEFDKLVVYKPNSEHNNVIEISTQFSFRSISYVETLLLLGWSDCISY